VTPYEGELPAYGTRTVELDLPGYHRLREDIPLPWPWWQFVPLDMVTDLLIPWTIEDHRSFSFQLEPVDPDAFGWDDAEAAHRRLEDMRAEAGAPADNPAAGDAEAPPAPEGGAPEGGANGATGGGLR